MLNEWKGMENIISSTFAECWEQSACFAMIRCLTGPQIVQVSSFVLVQNRLHPSILYRTDDYTSPAERTSVFVRQTVTWTSFSFSWKTRFGSFDQWTLFFFSHLFCSPCWQIWMSEASVLSVLSEPCAACSHWRKIKLKIHIFISRFELA